MSDNIPPDLINQELDARLRIPNEVWTDVMKLIPRRFLVKRVAPVCFRFKEICDKNVKTIHVITKANWFSYKLKRNDPIAKKQLEQLAANDCHLAGQFRLKEVRIIEENKAILRHCPDLFNGCTIGLRFVENNKSPTLFLECLAELEEAKPTEIHISQRVDVVDQVIDYWHHQTFQNCTRVQLSFWPRLSAATMMNVFDWLHHQPNVVDCDGSADQQVRCMILWRTGTGDDQIEWLVNFCSENIQQGREPADRRPFLFSFPSWFWTGFGQFSRIENKSTGEVLLLDRLMNDYGRPSYQFRRCLVKEEASRQDFYAGIFKRGEGYEEYDSFKIDENKPRVIIG